MTGRNRDDLERELEEARDTIAELQDELTRTNEGMVALTLELEEAEEKYRSLVETAPVGVFRTTFDGDIAYANPALADMFGYDSVEAFRDAGAHARYADEEDRDEFLDRLREAGAVDRFETTMVTESGDKIDVFFSGAIVDDQITGVMVDITDRKEAERKLQRTNRALRAISQSNKALIHSEDEETLLRDICCTVTDVGEYRFTWAGYTHTDGGERTVTPVAHAGYEDGFLDEYGFRWDDSRLGRGPVGEAARTGDPVVVNDVLADPDYAPWSTAATERGYAACVALPLRYEDETYGVLAIYSGETGSFNEEELELLAELADDMAFGIHALRVREEKEAAVQEIREKEKKYRHLFDNLTDAAFLVSLDTGRIVEANNRAEELTGYDADDLEGLHPADLHPPDEEEHYEQLFREDIEKGGSESLEAEVYTRDGDLVPVSISSSLIELGEERYVLGLFRDITDRKEAERELERREHRLSNLVETSNDAIITVDQDREIRLWNQAATEILGYAEEEALGEPIDLIVSEEHREKLLDGFDRYLDTGESPVVGDTTELEALRKDGTTVPVELSLSAYTVDDDTFFTGFLRDITERARALRELRKSEEKFRALTETSPDCIKLFDLDGNVEYINRAGLDEHGLDNVAEARDWDFVRSVREECRPDIRDALDRAREGESTTLEIEHTPEGSDRDWCLETISPVIDEGEVVSIFGVSRDITQVKEAEKEIREREERYSSLIDSASDAVISIDDDLEVVLWNEAAEETFGYAEEEILGTDVRRLYAEHDVAAFHDALERLRDTGEGFLVGEERGVRMLTRDGDRVPVEVSLSTYTVDGERVYTGIVRDISSRLERQRRIRRQEEELGVLDRLLRHNLRNEINVVQGHAELLEEALETPESRERVEKILDTTQTILDRSEKARRVRDAYSHAAPAGTVDLAPLARGVVEEARSRYPDAHVELHAPESLRARADEVFRYALAELVENAVEHSDQDTPEVRVTLEPVDGHARVRVEDDGPGIPKDERALIMEGEETALKHASGIGLWLVKWFTEVHGGRLEFGETEDGAAVTLLLDRA